MPSVLSLPWGVSSRTSPRTRSKISSTTAPRSTRSSPAMRRGGSLPYRNSDSCSWRLRSHAWWLSLLRSWSHAALRRRHRPRSLSRPGPVLRSDYRGNMLKRRPSSLGRGQGGCRGVEISFGDSRPGRGLNRGLNRRLFRCGLPVSTEVRRLF
ncbi:hypothetical protein SMALB_4567 [Streptomyces malaysiensis]|uniref:Uncharacterized protein n=1 Tax=Streptomyces malaysiensis TaxID=92644 RepID=A0A7X5X4M9_STRMQ|nr:hypothetical protein [Streptomyces malaysiensis]